MSTKNLGQVAGLFIGKTSPDNTLLIWYDNTPNQMCHRVYDVFKREWVPIDQKIISNITYSELVGLAGRVGLAIGKWYKITDRGNVVALAITPTKVQYTDIKGNILIDDLGTNVQYHVTSSNLLVDDIAGVFDEVTKKLVFRFEDNQPINSNEESDYIFGKGKRNGVWKLLKFKISRFISTTPGNSLSWNNGLFFSIREALKNYVDRDVDGGIVSYKTYSSHKKEYQKLLDSVAKGIQVAPDEFSKLLAEAISNRQVFNKTLSDELAKYPEPVNVRVGDTLYVIISKLWAHIAVLRYANGIRLTKDYKDAEREQFVNSNDTVQSAIGKLQYRVKNMGRYLTIPLDYAPVTGDSSSLLKVSPGDTLEMSVGKLEGKIIQTGLTKPYYFEKTEDAGTSSILDLNKALVNFSKTSTGHNSPRVHCTVNSLPRIIMPIITRANNGHYAVTDYMREHDTQTEKFKRYFPKGSFLLDGGMGSFGSSIVQSYLKKGFYSKAEKDDNLSQICTSIVGCFDADYTDGDTLELLKNISGRETYYTGIYGTYNFKSADHWNGYNFGGGFLDGGTLDDTPDLENGNRVFGGIFDRLMVRGLVYGYSNQDGAKLNSSDENEIHVSQTDTFLHLDAGSSATGIKNYIIVLPSDPIVGQSVRIYVDVSSASDRGKTFKVKVNQYMRHGSHQQFSVAGTVKGGYITITACKMYEFIYTNTGWKAFELNSLNPTD